MKGRWYVTCPVCQANVETSEYDYSADMCKECAEEEDERHMEQRRGEEVRKILYGGMLA